MEKPKNQNIDWKIIRKWIDDNLSPEEKNKLDEWTTLNPRHKSFLEDTKKYYESESISLPDNDKVNQAWIKFSKNNLRKQQRNFIRLGSIAASIIIIISIYFILKNENAQEEIVIAQNEINTGGSKALLILHDGKTINLNNRNNETLNFDNTTITIDSTGVSYLADSNDKTISYNTLRTPQGGEYSITLSDGTKVFLNAESELIYPSAFVDKDRKVKLKGEAFFDVTPNGKNFIIEINNFQITVLGTSFNVSAYDDENTITTTLMEGRVKLIPDTGEEVILTPGEQSLWDKVNGTMEIQEVNLGMLTKWKEGYFIFRDNKLENIMRTLKRWYDMDYEFESENLKDIRFYGIINKYENVKELLDQFEKTKKVNFIYNGQTIKIK